MIGVLWGAFLDRLAGCIRIKDEPRTGGRIPAGRPPGHWVVYMPGGNPHRTWLAPPKGPPPIQEPSPPTRAWKD